MGGDQYQVIAQVDRTDRTDLQIFHDYMYAMQAGENIPLSAVVHLVESSSPTTLYHFNRYKAATISASLAEGKTIGDGIKAMQAIADKTIG